MFNKIHNILGKLFLSCTAIFWFGCTDSNSEYPVNPPTPANESSSSNDLANQNSSPSEPLSSNAEQSSSAESISSSNAVSSSSDNTPSSSSNTPASSSSKLTPKNLPKVSFLDIDQIINKNQALSDTAGLMGKKVSASDYCRTTLQGVRYNFYDSALPTSSRNTAKRMINDELDSLLASPQAAAYSEEKRKCILDLKYSSWEGLPDYGIPAWYSCEHENEGKDSVKIDESYIKALENNKNFRYNEYMNIFEKTMNQAVRCDSLE